MVKYNDDMETEVGNIGDGLEMIYELEGEFFTLYNSGTSGRCLRAVDEDERKDIIKKEIFD